MSHLLTAPLTHSGLTANGKRGRKSRKAPEPEPESDAEASEQDQAEDQDEEDVAAAAAPAQAGDDDEDDGEDEDDEDAEVEGVSTRSGSDSIVALAAEQVPESLLKYACLSSTSAIAFVAGSKTRPFLDHLT